MNSRFLLICLSLFLTVAPRLHAQGDSLTVRPPEELDQLFGPIALYPDAVIALILPASTVPSDVVMAARYLRSNGDPTRIDGELWDDSVKSLSHYPEVVQWMDENLAWTKQAGEAFVAQPADVMNAIQRLRTAARAAGTLIDTPQQRVVYEDETIAIVPADPQVIYVPRYDPEVVYISRPGYYHDPFLTFGVGFSTGIWLGCYDFDWGRNRLCTIDRRDRERYWHDHLERNEWHGSPHVVPGPSHPRIVDEDRYRRDDWRPRHDSHRPTHVSGVVHTDSNRPDSPSRHSSDPRSDGRPHDPERTNDDHRSYPGRDGSNDRNRRPNTNNTQPAAVNTTGIQHVQPQRFEPAPAPAVANPTVSPQSQQNSPRPDGDHRDRRDREARANDRQNSSQNPQGRVMQLQTPVQPKQQNTPTVVNREARAPQSPPPEQARQHTSPSPVQQPPAQSRSQQTVVNAQPRAPQPQNNNSSNNDRKDRDDRRTQPN